MQDEPLTFPIIIHGNDVPGHQFGDYMRAFLPKATRGIWSVGYFYMSAFKVLGISLDRMESLRIIIGLETDEPTATMVEDARVEWLWRKLAVALNKDLDEFDFESSGSLFDAIHAKLVDGTIEIRAPLNPTHKKVYWMDQVDDVRDVVIRGSCNFSATGFGFTSRVQGENFEIDAYNDRTRAYKEHLETEWNAAVPFTRKLISVIENHPRARGHRDRKAREATTDPDGFRHVSPASFFKHVIAARRDFHLFDTGKIGLKSYQLADYHNCSEIIKKCGGVILADEAGLGKTIVSCRLLQDYYHDDKKFLVVCPPASQDQWFQTIEKMFGMSLSNGSKVISEGILQTGTFTGTDWRGFDVAVIDESHHFRNDETKKFKAFMTSFKAVNPDADIILVTATPVNNDVDDLVAQIRIIENTGKFRIHVGHDFDDFKGMAKKVDAMRRSKVKIPDALDEQMQDTGSRLQRKLVVRTTIREMRESGETFDINGQPANFQEVIPEQVSYTLSGPGYDAIFKALFPELLGALRFPHAGLLTGIMSLVDDDEDDGMASGFQITGLYKRFESSIHSFAVSLKNLREREGKLATLLEDPRFDARVMKIRRLDEKVTKMQGETDEHARRARDVLRDQLATLKRDIKKDWDATPPADAAAIRRISLAVTRTRKIDDVHVISILADILDDVRAIMAFEEMIDQLRDPVDPVSMHDDKIDALIALLTRFPEDKFLVFTQFKDTARYIKHVIAKHGAGSMVMIDGQMSEREKEDARAAFCPKYTPDKVITRVKNRHGGNLPPDARIMIATDAMSQSVNLQEARRVVNYDLPWNPMIMYQRNGRARRVDNPNPVDVYNFVPDIQIDGALGLIDTLKGKIDVISKVIGLPVKLLSKDDEQGESDEAIKKAFIDRLSRIRSTTGWVAGVERADVDDVATFLRMVVATMGWSRADVKTLRSDPAVPYTIVRGPPGAVVMFYTVSVARGNTRDYINHGALVLDAASGKQLEPGTFSPRAIDTVPRPVTGRELAIMNDVITTIRDDIRASASRSTRETKESMTARVQAHKEKNNLVKAIKRGPVFMTVNRETPEDKAIKSRCRKLLAILQKKELVTNDVLADIRAFSTRWIGERRGMIGETLKSLYAELDDIVSRVKDAGDAVDSRNIEVTVDGIAVFRP